MMQMNRRFWILAGLTALVLVVAYGPLLWQFFANQWEKPHYQYFPFVIGAFVWLLWQRCRQAVPRRWEHGAGSEEQGVVADPHPGLLQGTLTRSLSEGEKGRDPHPGLLPEGDGMGEDDGRRAANRYDVAVALIAAILLLGLAYFANSPWLAYISAICLVTSCFLSVSRDWHVPYLWGVWLLVWLVVPLPMNRDQQLINRLQGLSSQLSSFVLDWVGVTHLMEGNTLILPDKQFFVDEACSGIVSVMSIIACAVIYGVWRNRSPVHLVTLAAAGIGWATLMNVVRISVIAMAYQWYGVDWSKGTPHEMLGLVIFLFTFLALICTDYALVVLLAPVRESYIQQFGDPVTCGAWFVRVWDWLQAWGRPIPAWSHPEGTRQGAGSGPGGITNDECRMTNEARGVQSTSSIRYPAASSLKPTSDTRHNSTVFDAELSRNELAEVPTRNLLASRFVMGLLPLAVFTALAGAQFAIPRPAPRSGGLPQNVDRALAIDASGLPESIHGAVRTTFSKLERERDDLFGNYSRLYEYRDERGNVYQVSCDFPLEPGGHELTVCYQGIGWHMAHRGVETNLGGDDDPDGISSWGYGVADFTKPDGSAAYLAFCSFDEYGTRVTPPTFSFWNDVWRALRKHSHGEDLGRSYTVQVWTVSPGTVREEQKQLARQLLLQVRDRFRQLVTGEGENQELRVKSREPDAEAEQRGEERDNDE